MVTDVESPDHKRKTNYCIRMWLLQEVVGCTFLEARIYLRKERNETLKDLASVYNMPLHELQVIEQSATEKVSRVQSTKQLFYGFEPIYPGDSETVEW